jgi:hypothetical protein
LLYGSESGHERTFRDSFYGMPALKAHVRSGHIVVDEPTDLPEGTEIRLVMPDDGDEFDDDEREALHRALARGSSDIVAGRVVDALDFLNTLDKRR